MPDPGPPLRPPGSDSEALEQVVERFEAAWQAGDRPALSDFLPPVPGPRRAVLLELILTELELRWRGGEPIRVEDYLGRFAELRDDHAALLQLIDRERQLRRRREPELTDAEYAARFPDLAGVVVRGPTWANAGKETPVGGRTDAGAPALPTTAVPCYEILGEIGRGAMGVVYRARDLRLKRVVALKMILAGGHADPESRARFRHEAEAAARFQHPNLVQIHEVGEHEGLPYCALEFVDGGTLADRLGSGPLPPAAAAALAQTLARAVHCAHQRGVVHRDLKPANILLTVDGTPKVADFGLAKDLTAEVGRTRSGAIVGTPAYMAPEQAAGHSHKVGPAADVWALGAVLYETLTGRPPFQGPTSFDVLRQVLADDPTPPARLNPKVPRELETICLTCLHKESAQRYGSALLLAQDLERFGGGEPILARPEGPLRRFGRRLRRYRVAALAAIVVVVALLLSGLVVWRSLGQSQAAGLVREVASELVAPDWGPERVEALEPLLTELEQTDPGRAADARQHVAERLAEFVRERLARRHKLEAAELARVDDAVRRLEPLNPTLAEELRQARENRQRDWLTILDLRAPFDGAAGAFAGDVPVVADGGVLRLEPSAKRRWTQTAADSDGNAELEAVFDAAWQSASGVSLSLNCKPGFGDVTAMSHAPDGRTLALGNGWGELVLINGDDGKELRTWQVHDKEITALAYLPDGGSLLIGTSDGVIKWWDTTAGKLRHTFSVPKVKVRVLAISPDGRHLAAGFEPSRVFHTWDLQRPESAPRTFDHVHRVAYAGGVVFSPDGRTLHTAEHTQWIAWDFASGKQLYTTRGEMWHAIDCLALSPDGARLAVAFSGKLAVFDTETKRRVGFFTPGWWIHALAFSPDGRTLALATGNGSVVLWDVPAGRSRVVLRSDHQGPRALAYVPGNPQALDVLYAGGSVIRWDLARQQSRDVLGQGSYIFALEKKEPGERQEVANSIALATGRDEPYRMRIYRDRMLTIEQGVNAPAGPVRLLARRDGDLVTFQVNDLPPVRLRDVLPHRPAGGTFGFYWSAGVGLVRLRAEQQRLPPGVGPLEAANGLFDRGKFRDALAGYEDFIRVTGRGPAEQRSRREAECKAAVCLVQLNRDDEAVRRLQRVAAEAGDADEPWPALAGLQLWRVYHRQERAREAAALIHTLIRRHPRTPTAPLPNLLTAGVRNDILHSHGDLFTNAQGVFFQSPFSTRRLEEALDVNEYLRVPPERLHYLRALLVQTYHAAGEKDKARELGEKLLAGIGPAAAAIRDGWAYHQRVFDLDRLAWLERACGKPEPFLAALDGVLIEAEQTARRTRNGRDTQFLHQLLLERGRLLAALGRWDEAEKAAERLLALKPAEVSYGQYAEACLLHGYLLERRGEKDLARQAWTRALYTEYVKHLKPPNTVLNRSEMLGSGHHSTLALWLPAVLTDTLSDKEASEYGKHVTEYLAPRREFFQRQEFPASVFREMLKAPRGRVLGRRFALGEASHVEVGYELGVLLLVEWLRQFALPGERSADQEAVLHTLAEETWRGVAYGELTEKELVPFEAAWGGQLGPGGWESIKSALPPSLRGPAAYVLGRRYARTLKRPADAEALFRTAHDDAPPDSALRRLAKAELNRAEGE